MKRRELVVNLKTAKALGITVLHTVLARADEVIEGTRYLPRCTSRLLTHTGPPSVMPAAARLQNHFGAR